MTKEEDFKKDIPSNDDIVDELVKDFKSSCETNQVEKESDQNEEDKCPDNENNAGTSNTDEFDELVDDKPKKKREDFIDEDELKEKELSYSEEDKQRLKTEAEEHKKKGNTFFKDNDYKSSVEYYTLGLRTCPLAYPKERAILYANRAAAKIKLDENEPALEDCSKAVELDPCYIRALLRRAQLQESMDHLDEAFEDFKKLLELDPSNKDAIMACQRLPPLINERNEKMKTEMLGKLKDLGNVFLRPFGLSTENFKMVQDPNTGGYSVNFQQNS